MVTGFEAMRLGSVIYFIPFFFVLDPALILAASIGQTLLILVLAIAGILFFASAMQGYLVGIGHLNPVERLCLLSGSLLLSMPGESVLLLAKIEILLFSAALILPMIALAARRNLRTSELVRA